MLKRLDAGQYTEFVRRASGSQLVPTRYAYRSFSPYDPFFFAYADAVALNNEALLAQTVQDWSVGNRSNWNIQLGSITHLTDTLNDSLSTATSYYHCTFTFSIPYSTSPSVVVGLYNAMGMGFTYQVTDTTGTFRLNNGTTTTFPAGTVYKLSIVKNALTFTVDGTTQVSYTIFGSESGPYTANIKSSGTNVSQAITKYSFVLVPIRWWLVSNRTSNWTLSKVGAVLNIPQLSSAVWLTPTSLQSIDFVPTGTTQIGMNLNTDLMGSGLFINFVGGLYAINGGSASSFTTGDVFTFQYTDPTYRIYRNNVEIATGTVGGGLYFYVSSLNGGVGGATNLLFSIPSPPNAYWAYSRLNGYPTTTLLDWTLSGNYSAIYNGFTSGYAQIYSLSQYATPYLTLSLTNVSGQAWFGLSPNHDDVSGASYLVASSNANGYQLTSWVGGTSSILATVSEGATLEIQYDSNSDGYIQATDASGKYTFFGTYISAASYAFLRTYNSGTQFTNISLTNVPLYSPYWNFTNTLQNLSLGSNYIAAPLGDNIESSRGYTTPHAVFSISTVGMVLGLTTDASGYLSGGQGNFVGAGSFITSSGTGGNSINVIDINSQSTPLTLPTDCLIMTQISGGVHYTRFTTSQGAFIMDMSDATVYTYSGNYYFLTGAQSAASIENVVFDSNAIDPYLPWVTYRCNPSNFQLTPTSIHSMSTGVIVANSYSSNLTPYFEFSVSNLATTMSVGLTTVSDTTINGGYFQLDLCTGGNAYSLTAYDDIQYVYYTNTSLAVDSIVKTQIDANGLQYSILTKPNGAFIADMSFSPTSLTSSFGAIASIQDMHGTVENIQFTNNPVLPTSLSWVSYVDASSDFIFTPTSIQSLSFGHVVANSYSESATPYLEFGVSRLGTNVSVGLTTSKDGLLSNAGYFQIDLCTGGNAYALQAWDTVPSVYYSNLSLATDTVFHTQISGGQQYSQLRTALGSLIADISCAISSTANFNAVFSLNDYTALFRNILFNSDASMQPIFIQPWVTYTGSPSDFAATTSRIQSLSTGTIAVNSFGDYTTPYLKFTVSDLLTTMSAGLTSTRDGAITNTGYFQIDSVGGGSILSLTAYDNTQAIYYSNGTLPLDTVFYTQISGGKEYSLLTSANGAFIGDMSYAMVGISGGTMRLNAIFSLQDLSSIVQDISLTNNAILPTSLSWVSCVVSPSNFQFTPTSIQSLSSGLNIAHSYNSYLTPFLQFDVSQLNTNSVQVGLTTNRGGSYQGGGSFSIVQNGTSYSFIALDDGNISYYNNQSIPLDTVIATQVIGGLQYSRLTKPNGAFIADMSFNIATTASLYAYAYLWDISALINDISYTDIYYIPTTLSWVTYTDSPSVFQVLDSNSVRTNSSGTVVANSYAEYQTPYLEFGTDRFDVSSKMSAGFTTSKDSLITNAGYFEVSKVGGALSLSAWDSTPSVYYTNPSLAIDTLFRTQISGGVQYSRLTDNTGTIIADISCAIALSTSFNAIFSLTNFYPSIGGAVGIVYNSDASMQPIFIQPWAVASDVSASTLQYWSISQTRGFNNYTLSYNSIERSAIYYTNPTNYISFGATLSDSINIGFSASRTFLTGPDDILYTISYNSGVYDVVLSSPNATPSRLFSNASVPVGSSFALQYDPLSNAIFGEIRDASSAILNSEVSYLQTSSSMSFFESVSGTTRDVLTNPHLDLALYRQNVSGWRASVINGNGASARLAYWALQPTQAKSLNRAAGTLYSYTTISGGQFASFTISGLQADANIGLTSSDQTLTVSGAYFKLRGDGTNLSAGITLDGSGPRARNNFDMASSVFSIQLSTNFVYMTISDATGNFYEYPVYATGNTAPYQFVIDTQGATFDTSNIIFNSDASFSPMNAFGWTGPDIMNDWNISGSTFTRRGTANTSINTINTFARPLLSFDLDSIANTGEIGLAATNNYGRIITYGDTRGITFTSDLSANGITISGLTAATHYTMYPVLGGITLDISDVGISNSYTLSTAGLNGGGAYMNVVNPTFAVSNLSIVSDIPSLSRGGWSNAFGWTVSYGAPVSGITTYDLNTNFQGSNFIMHSVSGNEFPNQIFTYGDLNADISAVFGFTAQTPTSLSLTGDGSNNVYVTISSTGTSGGYTTFRVDKYEGSNFIATFSNNAAGTDFSGAYISATGGISGINYIWNVDVVDVNGTSLTDIGPWPAGSSLVTQYTSVFVQTNLSMKTSTVTGQ